MSDTNTILTGDAQPTGGDGTNAAATDTGAPAGQAGAPQGTATEATGSTEPAAQGDGAADGEAGDKPAGDAPASTVPEKYEFAVPEGVTLNAEMLGEFEGVARELGLDQAGAQKVVDIAAKLQARQAEQVSAALQQQSAEWVQSAATDQEIGGAKLPENLAVARKGLEAFASPELRKLLDESRLGNNPEVVRMFYRVGKALAEDKVVTGETKAPPKSMAAVLYDKT